MISSHGHDIERPKHPTRHKGSTDDQHTRECYEFMEYASSERARAFYPCHCGTRTSGDAKNGSTSPEVKRQV